MATNPSQTSKDLTTPSLYVPTAAEVEHRLAQLQSHLSQQNRNPQPTPEQPEPPRAASPQPPTPTELDKAALHGLAGRIVNNLAPHTEARPAALLLQFLAAFGNLIGPGPHCMVESTRHALNLFVILVGDSSKARKGTSWNLIANLFAGVDPSWLSTRVNSARLTANGLVRALRDQQPPTDRRLLALSEEFATVVHSLKRGNCLPGGGSPPAEELSAIAATLRTVVAWAAARPEILFGRDQEAQKLWADCYESLSYRDPGLRGAATSRGEAQVLRLSALYAALDSSEIVCLPHLEAAYAVWTYCYRSAVRLFGLATGDPIADGIREAVQASPNGLSRNQISRLFYGHVDSERIDAALEQLAAFGAIAAYSEQTNGRRSTLWLAFQH